MGHFNYWDFYWGGDAIRSHSQQAKGAKLIEFILNLSVVKLFQRGTLTYYSSLGSLSIINLVFSLNRQAGCVLEYKFHNTYDNFNH